MNKISIIGAGNGGQAIAGYCASLGMSVCLYNRTHSDSFKKIRENGKINLIGQINTVGSIDLFSSDIKEACEFSDLIFIVTPADSHKSLAHKIAPFITSDHIVLLNPGRTLGSLEFERELTRHTDITPNIGEAQTLVYACRAIEPGVVNVIGVKDRVPVACSPNSNINKILETIKPIYPSFEKGKSLLEVGLDNIGSIFHPSVVLFNAATIEREESFYFYRDMTPQIASVIEELDKERIAVGKAYGIDLMSVTEWIKYAYPSTEGDDLCQRMRNNPAYHDIKAPGSIFTRQLTEDIPTGLVPISELGHKAGVPTPIMDSIITIISTLLNVDFRKNGRTLSNLGLKNVSSKEIVTLLK